MTKSYASITRRIGQGMNNYFEGVPEQMRKARILLWPLFIGLTVMAFMGLGKVKFDMTVEGWFEKDDPSLVSLEAFRSQFGSDDNLYVIYEPADGDVFSQRSLELARGIREDLLTRKLNLKEGEPSPLRHIVKITALPNAPVLTAEGDALISRHLIRGPVPSGQNELDKIRAMAQSQETFPKLYFSPDGRYGGIVIETDFGLAQYSSAPDLHSGAGETGLSELRIEDVSMAFDGTAEQAAMQFQSTDLSEYYDFIKAIQVTLEKPEFAGYFKYYPVGNAATTEHDVMVLEEAQTLYLAMLGIMVVVLWSLFRNLSGMLWPIVIVVLSCIWTVGFTGWLGMTVTGFVVLTIVMILVVGIADSIHILSGYVHFRDQGFDHRQAMRRAYYNSGNATLLTSITTMAAMLSDGIIPIVPMRVFAVMTAAGIGIAWLLAIYLLPLLIDLWQPTTMKHSNSLLTRMSLGRLFPDISGMLQRWLTRIIPFVQRNRFTIIALFAGVFVATIYGASQVRIDTDPVAQYPKDSKMRENFMVADQNMVGSQTLAVYFDLGVPYAFQEPWVLKKLEEMQNEIEQKYSQYVIRTASIADVAKKSYQTLNENRPEMHIVPPTPELLSQTLFMFDNSNPTERRKMVTDDYSSAHITVYLRNAGSYEYRKVFNSLQQDVDRYLTTIHNHDYPEAKARVTGLFTLMMTGADYLSKQSLASFGIALLAISILMWPVFGTFKLATIGMSINVLPSLLAYGLMGLFKIPLDFTTCLIAPIIIGIALDDTIHVMDHYKKAINEGCTVVEALQRTMESVGQAVVFSSLILGLGLSVLMLSSSVGTATAGFIGSFAMLSAVLYDLFLMPALLIVFNREPVKDEQGIIHAIPKPLG